MTNHRDSRRAGLAERDAAIIDAIQHDPDATVIKLAAQYHLTRQRIYAIIAQHLGDARPTKARRRRVHICEAPGCMSETLSGYKHCRDHRGYRPPPKMMLFRCEECGKRFVVPARVGRKGRRYCSRPCRDKVMRRGLRRIAQENQ